MKISLYLIAFLLAFFIEIVTSHVRLERLPQQYCGSKLADVMKLLCAAKYHDPATTQKPGKRSGTEAYVWNYSDLANDYNDMDYPHRSKLDAMYFAPSSSFKNTPSKRYRIVDECCRKPCYMSELRSYCSS